LVDPDEGGGVEGWSGHEGAQMIGTTVSHFKILEKLGGGGMGVVYRALDTRLKRTVALKFLPPDLTRDEDAKTRFIQEAQAASALQHPNICAIHDIEQTDDHRLFIVMDCYDGQSLKQLIEKGPMLIDRAVDIATQVAQGLAKAHESGIVHRDIKPANIMIGKDGIVRIVDFGLAKLSGQTMLTKSGSMVGTAAYMSPEQARGEKVDHRTDIWSLGVVLNEMLTGQQPFASEYEQAMMYSILNGEPKPIEELRPEVPGNIIGIVQRAMEKDKDKRFQTAAEMAEVLRGDGKPLKKKISRRKKKMLWYATAAVVVVAVALSAFLTMMQAEVIDSIAVLPPRSLSTGQDDELFSEGILDGLIGELSSVKALTTKGKQSVMRFKKTDKSYSEIAAELGGVKAFLEPTFRKVEGRLIIKAKLIRASNADVLDIFDLERNSEDVLALYSDLAQAVVQKVRVAVTTQEQHQSTSKRKVDPEVYRVTLEAKRALEYSWSQEQFRKAIELFQKAIGRDSTYAPAWAGLGEATWSLAMMGFEFVAPEEVREKAIAAASKALELDPNLPDAHKACAVIAWDGEWDLAKSQRHFERTLELQPGYAAAHNLYGQLLSGGPLPRFDEGLRHLDRARELDPLSPWNDIMLIAWWLYQGRPQGALELGVRARQRDPKHPAFPWQMGLSHLLLAQPGQAVREFEEALKLQEPDRPASTLAPLGLAYGLAGHRTEALKIMAELNEASQKRYVSPYYIAAVNSGLGRMDEAFRLLDRALKQKTTFLVACTQYDPVSVALRRDPRWNLFIDKLRPQIKLPPGTPDPYE
jgi:eukaryotic-like serine/threonine-protein kinase